MAASATFALSLVCGSGAGSWVLLIRWAQRARCQAETPLIDLFRFAEPALSTASAPPHGLIHQREATICEGLTVHRDAATKKPSRYSLRRPLRDTRDHPKVKSDLDTGRLIRSYRAKAYLPPRLASHVVVPRQGLCPRLAAMAMPATAATARSRASGT